MQKPEEITVQSLKTSVEENLGVTNIEDNDLLDKPIGDNTINE